MILQQFTNVSSRLCFLLYNMLIVTKFVKKSIITIKQIHFKEQCLLSLNGYIYRLAVHVRMYTTVKQYTFTPLISWVLARVFIMNSWW